MNTLQQIVKQIKITTRRETTKITNNEYQHYLQPSEETKKPLKKTKAPLSNQPTLKRGSTRTSTTRTIATTVK